jgi:hypothetical protein
MIEIIYFYCNLLGDDIVKPCRRVTTFWRKLLLPPLEYYFPKVKATFSSESVVTTKLSALRHVYGSVLFNRDVSSSECIASEGRKISECIGKNKKNKLALFTRTIPALDWREIE